MHSAPLFIAVVFALAVIFDFTNGFHDASNAVATTIATRALSPRWALALVATMNLAGAFLSTNVATTIGTGVVSLPIQHAANVILAALIGAVGWNLITWYAGLPSSSSHALIGGLVGATVAAGSTAHVRWDGLLTRVLLPGIVSPLAGFGLGFVLMLALYWACFRARPTPIRATFRRLQVLSAAVLAFSHGSNDAQKTMAIISLVLVSAGDIHRFYVPDWVIVVSAGAMALGTFSGGWRIIHTMGRRVIRVDPPNGFATELSASIVLLVASLRGYPISTTQVVNGALVGVGATRRFSAVRWGVAGNIAIAWVLTLPAAALISATAFLLVGKIDT